MTDPKPRTFGFHHVGLTVPRLPAARQFFEDALGFEAVGEVADHPAVFLSDGTGMVTLWQAENGDEATRFDRRRNLGLHHLALRVEGASALDTLAGELAERDDVEIAFPPESLGGGPTRHMMCIIPGGIRLELIAPASA